MLIVSNDPCTGVLTLEPKGELSVSDFEQITHIVDEMVDAHGVLNGVMLKVQHFPGWDSFSALLAHAEFVKKHHRVINKVAIVTDSVVGSVAESFGAVFLRAIIRQFAASDEQEALQWLAEGVGNS